MKRVILSATNLSQAEMEELLAYHAQTLVDELVSYARTHGETVHGGFRRNSTFFTAEESASDYDYSFELYSVDPASVKEPRTRFVDAFIVYSDKFGDATIEECKETVDQWIQEYIYDRYHMYE